MKTPVCPQCQHIESAKSGIVKNRQRYRCKQCNYHFTVEKVGKQIDSYYVIKALQLYIEGVSYREIERLLGISHVSVMNWVKKMGREGTGTAGVQAYLPHHEPQRAPGIYAGPWSIKRHGHAGNGAGR